MNNLMSRTEYVDVEGGRIAYEVVGHGPLVVLYPGIADTRSSYRFLAPLIANASYRVASVDLRGHGESSTGWDSYSRADTAGDLIDVIRKLGGPAVIVGQSFSGGAATIAAATNPDLLSSLVEIAPAAAIGLLTGRAVTPDGGFDKPLSKAQVLAKAGPLIKS